MEDVEKVVGQWWQKLARFAEDKLGSATPPSPPSPPSSSEPPQFDLDSLQTTMKIMWTHWREGSPMHKEHQTFLLYASLAVFALVSLSVLLVLYFFHFKRKWRRQEQQQQQVSVEKVDDTDEKIKRTEGDDLSKFSLAGRVDKKRGTVDLSKSEMGKRVSDDSGDNLAWQGRLVKSVDWSTITQLDLSYNSLNGMPSMSLLSQLTRLTTLNFRGNRLPELPASTLQKLQSLTSLDIGHNQFEYFPQALLDKPMKRLIMDHNFIVVLPPDIGRMSDLEELDISHNGLLKIPHEFAHLKKLRRLSLQGNRFMNHVTGILEKMTLNNPELYDSLAPSIAELSHPRRRRTIFGWKTPHSSSRSSEPGSSDRSRSSTLKLDKNDIKDCQPSISLTEPNAKTVVVDATMRKMRIQAVNEVVESESRYIKFMKLLHEYYYVPILKGVQSPVITNATSDMHMNFSDEILPPKIISRNNLISQDLVSVIKFNESLHDALTKEIPQKSSTFDSLIGHIFVERAAFLKLYSSYVGNHHMYQHHLIAAMDKCPRFNQELEKGRSIPDANGLDLMSLLIMPIQRLPRYNLLIQNVLRYTPPQHEDYAALKTASDKIVKITVEINNRIAEISKRLKVIDISVDLGLKDLVQPHRLFISESDSLTRHGSRVGVILFNDLLVVRDLDMMNRMLRVLKQKSPIRMYELLRGTTVEPVDGTATSTKFTTKPSFRSFTKRLSSHRKSIDSTRSSSIFTSSPSSPTDPQCYTLSIQKIRNTKRGLSTNNMMSLCLSAETEEYRTMWINWIKEVVEELKQSQ